MRHELTSAGYLMVERLISSGPTTTRGDRTAVADCGAHLTWDVESTVCFGMTRCRNEPTSFLSRNPVVCHARRLSGNQMPQSLSNIVGEVLPACEPPLK
jgi:hypothetical protein